MISGLVLEGMRHATKLVCAALLLGAAVFPAPVDPGTKEVRKTVDLNPDGQVVIDTYKGSITVKAWDSSRVEIYARVEPDGAGRAWKEKIEATEIRIDDSPDSVRIKTEYEKVKWLSRRSWNLFDWNDGTLPLVHYTIQMPRTARLRIKDYKSKTDIGSLRSEVDVDTYKGEVVISGLDGSLSLNTYKGEARVRFANLARRSRFETYKGEIEIVLPRDKGFDLETEIGRHGRLDSSFEVGLKSPGKGFGSSVSGGGPVVYMKTYKGTYRLRRG